MFYGPEIKKEWNNSKDDLKRFRDRIEPPRSFSVRRGDSCNFYCLKPEWERDDGQ